MQTNVDPFSSLIPGNEPLSKVEISVECKKLPNLDTLSLSDPQVFMYVEHSGKWVQEGKTEMIKNNLAPKFSTTLKLGLFFAFEADLPDYYFEKVQKLKFKVYDIDNINGGLDREFLTELFFCNSFRARFHWRDDHQFG